MARHMTPRHKVVSSGRLTGSSRGQITRKKVAGRPLHRDPSYSLYSTDSEDQVTTINKGLDRCAALLGGILHAEKADPETKSQILRVAPSKKKALGKNDADRKRVGKKTPGAHINKRPAPVQKTILSSQTYPGLRGKSCVRGMQQPSDGTFATQVECVESHSFPLGGSLPETGQQPSTVFNCRLTTSTPALSPQRPTSASSLAPHRGAGGEMHHFTQHWAPASAVPSTQHGSSSATVSPTQYTAFISVAPSVQGHPAVVSTIHPGQLEPSSPVIHAPHAVPGGQNSGLPSNSGPQICPSPPVPARILTPVPLPIPTRVPVCDSSQDLPLSSGECASSTSEESGDCMSEEDELDRVDTMPVRETSCRTGDEHNAILKYRSKTESPEKTTRKVMTVKYLLGELKALVANQDSEAVRLISEVEQSVSLLPAMVGSTNIQAELALAVQPLRSENVQLRRRLRILNQQLQERERAERQARPLDCNLELVSLQSQNLTLQTQLNDCQRELKNLQQENQTLRQAVMDRENELQQTKEKCELETNRIRMDVSEALAEMRSCQTKLEDSEREKAALTQSLQQKESEITQLTEIIRDLQKNLVSSHLVQKEVYQPPAAQLTRSVLDQYENEQQEPSVANRITDTVKAYLQTLEDSGHVSPPHPARSQPNNLPQSSCGQWSRGQAISPKSSNAHTSHGNTAIGSVNQEVETTFVPLRETAQPQPASVPQRHSPDQGNGHTGLKYIGLAFNKLGISNSLPSPSDEHSTDHSLHPDGLRFQINQLRKSVVNPADQTQSQHARRRLHMGEASQYAGMPSIDENSFSSCDIKSLTADWSVNSYSTFNTRDEQDFRKGLEALDASIASLQRTLKADLKR